LGMYLGVPAIVIFGIRKKFWNCVNFHYDYEL
jgi:hypothetical protein